MTLERRAEMKEAEEAGSFLKVLLRMRFLRGLEWATGAQPFHNAVIAVSWDNLFWYIGMAEKSD